MSRAFGLLLAVVLLSGCAAVSALNRAAAPSDVFELRAPADLPRTQPTRNIQIGVEMPDGGGAVSTDGILVRLGAAGVSYLPDVRWSAPAPEMLQSAIVESLLRTEAFSFVGTRPLSASGDLVLLTRILEFGAFADVESSGGQVELTLVVSLVRERDAEIVARRTFSRTARVPDTGTGPIVAGYTSATDAVLTDLTRWVLDQAR